MGYSKNENPFVFTDILFIDIETVAQYESILSCPSPLFELFKHKYQAYFDKMVVFDREYNWQKCWEEKACLHAEFGKIFNITLGKQINANFFVKSICHYDEKILLKAFLESMSEIKPSKLCAHNGHEFDFPFLYRRMLINELPVPELLNTFNKKPWVITDNLFDTLKMWSNTQYNYRASLELLAVTLGFPSPKQEIHGDMVNKLYWSPYTDKLINGASMSVVVDQISEYGKGDVITLAKIFCKMASFTPLSDDIIKTIQYDGK